MAVEAVVEAVRHDEQARLEHSCAAKIRSGLVRGNRALTCLFCAVATICLLEYYHCPHERLHCPFCELYSNCSILPLTPVTATRLQTSSQHALQGVTQCRQVAANVINTQQRHAFKWHGLLNSSMQTGQPELRLLAMPGGQVKHAAHKRLSAAACRTIRWRAAARGGACGASAPPPAPRRPGQCCPGWRSQRLGTAGQGRAYHTGRRLRQG